MAAETPTSLPPGPSMPRWAQTAGFIFRPAWFIDNCRRRFGVVVSFRSLDDPCFVMVFDPDLVKQVFRGQPNQLRAGEANAVLGPVVGESSLLLLDGERHLHERKLLLPPFHGERMRAYDQVMREAADAAIDSWPVGERFELLPSMRLLTLDIILRAVFGVDEGPRMEELKRRIREMIDPTATRFGVLLLALSSGRFGAGAGERFEQRRRAVDELIYEEIARRRDALDLEQREDVFSMLLLARDEDGRAMTDQELRDELVTLLVAGHETTATGLAWTFELLLRNPQVLDRLRSSLAEGDRAYLDAVVKEALRVKPVIAGVGRVVREEPFELGGYTVPPGIEINPSIAAIHRRADRYAQPREFRPDAAAGAAAASARASPCSRWRWWSGGWSSAPCWSRRAAPTWACARASPSCPSAGCAWCRCGRRCRPPSRPPSASPSLRAASSRARPRRSRPAYCPRAAPCPRSPRGWTRGSG